MSARARVTGSILLALTLAGPVPAQAQWPPWLAQDEAPPDYPAIAVTADSLARGDFVVLDARDADAWSDGHVPGAVSAPADEMDLSSVAAWLAPRGITGRERIVCAGAPDDVARTARLFWLLEAAGCPDVRILDGGLPAWAAAGGALVTAEPARAVTSWAVDPREDRVASAAFVRERFGRPDTGRPDTEILDARPEAEWSGLSDPDGGHIPHSLPVDPGAFLRADGRFAPAESIRALVDRLGPREATTVDLTSEFVTTDDGASPAGALLYLALRIAGVERVRYFPGGWAEWSANGFPRVRIAAAPEIRALLEQARAGTRDVVLADVRGAADFRAVHIPGALSIPPVGFADSLGVVLAREQPGLDRARATFVAYCYGPECVRSRNATTVAAQQGFRDSIWFRGGLPEWIRNGGDVVRAAVGSTPPGR